jgi:hypothetical protein
MANHASKLKGGTPVNPSEGESNNDNNNPKTGNDVQLSKEGDYRNAETAVNNPSYFNDDYEADQETQITEEEAKEEKKNRGAGRK